MVKNSKTERAKQLGQCEREILDLFSDYSITLKEATFMMEKIKFHAFMSDFVEVSRNQGHEKITVKDTMFR